MLREGFQEMILFGAPRVMQNSNRSNMSIIEPAVAIRLLQQGHTTGFFKAGITSDYTTYKKLENLSANVSKVLKVDTSIDYHEMRQEIAAFTERIDIREYTFITQHDYSFILYVIYRLFKDYLFPLEPITIEISSYVEYAPYFMKCPEKVDVLVKIAEEFQEVRNRLVTFESINVHEALGVDTLVENRELSRKVNSYLDTLEGFIRKQGISHKSMEYEANRLLTNSLYSIGKYLNKEDKVAIFGEIIRKGSKPHIIGDIILRSLPQIDETYLMDIHLAGKTLNCSTQVPLMRVIKSLIPPVYDSGYRMENPIINFLCGDTEEERYNSIKVSKGFPDITFELRIDLGRLNAWKNTMLATQQHNPILSELIYSMAYLGYDTDQIPTILNLNRMGIAIQQAIIIPSKEDKINNETLLNTDCIDYKSMEYNSRGIIGELSGEMQLIFNLNSLLFSKYYSPISEVWDGN